MILFFGKLHDIAGVDRMDCPVDSKTFALSDLVSAIASLNPELGEALHDPSVRAAVNKQMLAPDDDAELNADDEIAFMPPLSGG